MATLNETFTNIANAIRNKTGDTATMTPAEMVTKINNISTLDISKLSATVTMETQGYHVSAGESVVINLTLNSNYRTYLFFYSDIDQDYTITNTTPILNKYGLYVGEITGNQLVYTTPELPSQGSYYGQYCIIQIG